MLPASIETSGFYLLVLHFSIVVLAGDILRIPKLWSKCFSCDSRGCYPDGRYVAIAAGFVYTCFYLDKSRISMGQHILGFCF